MAQPVKQNAKRANTSRTDMLRMAATARMISVKVSEIPSAKEKFAKAQDIYGFQKGIAVGRRADNINF